MQGVRLATAADMAACHSCGIKRQVCQEVLREARKEKDRCGNYDMTEENEEKGSPVQS